MAATVSVVRTEKKYSITRMQQNVLLHRLPLVLKPDKYCRRGGYLVRSLYFDSVYDNDYFDKVNGLECRKKVRLRIYDPHQETVKLELKQKQGSAQNKRSLIISRELAKELIAGSYSGLLDIDSELAAQFYLIMEQGVYRPKCIVEYKRIAFAEDTNNIRVTFDSEIGVSHMYQDFFKENIALIPVRQEPVLEVKYNGFLLSGVKQMLEFADASELAISKYLMCRDVLMA